MNRLYECPESQQTIGVCQWRVAHRAQSNCFSSVVGHTQQQVPYNQRLTWSLKAKSSVGLRVDTSNRTDELGWWPLCKGPWATFGEYVRTTVGGVSVSMCTGQASQGIFCRALHWILALAMRYSKCDEGTSVQKHQVNGHLRPLLPRFRKRTPEPVSQMPCRHDC